MSIGHLYSIMTKISKEGNERKFPNISSLHTGIGIKRLATLNPD